MRKMIFVVTIAVFLFSTTMVVKHQVEMRIGAEQAQAVIQMVVSSSPKQPEREASETTSNELDAFAPIQVDFDALLGKNQDVVAWLYCPGTPINYPVVQAADNEHYLHRLLDGSRNSAGTLFMDYRNAEGLSDWNCVIYGHNMKNGSMFGSLPDYKAQSYFQMHPELFLLTPGQDYVIKLVAGFTTPASSELYNTFAPDANERTRLLDTWIRDSDFDSGVNPVAEDRLITLSTCSYEYSDARYVLIGILQELSDEQV